MLAPSYPTYSPPDLIALIRNTAEAAGVDADLAVSISKKESLLGWPRLSSRFEPLYRYLVDPGAYANKIGISVDTETREQMSSWGPMHIMGGRAREIGYSDALPLLFIPPIGIYWACKNLKILCDKYENESAVIAAYNAGSPRKMIKGGATQYVNQAYVDEVQNNLRMLRQVH